MKPALLVDNLSYAYGRSGRALEGVSFSVEAGCFTALLGPNGTGKTTLMALITGLFANRGSRIEICGHDLANETRAALASIGVVFQRPTLDLDLTVQQNLVYAARLYGLGRQLTGQRIETNLERLGIGQLRSSTVRTLSGGMRRRVELVRALLHEPKLLVLDEPTVGLDIDSRRDIVAHVHALCRERGLAVLWTTHLIDEIERGDEVLLLANGGIAARGSIDEIAAAAGAEDLGAAYRHFCGARAAA